MTPRNSNPASFFLALCAACGWLALSTASVADSSRQPAITEAHADGGVLRIFGLNLGSAKPKVTLGTLTLSVVATTATQIDALIPATLGPGSYLLTVNLDKPKGTNDRNDDDGKYDEFWVTIGATGPAGKDGAAGPQGPAGIAGPPGLAGAAGIPGPAGPSGPQGPAGPPGATGPQGSQGLAGPAGREGPMGPAGKDGAPGANGRDGATGPQGPVGPQGPAGVGGSPLTIQSLVGLPCTVAMCPGSTAVAFDPATSGMQLTCVRVPGSQTLRIQGMAIVGAKLVTLAMIERLQFTSDVPGFAGVLRTHDAQGGPVAFEISVNTLCPGQPVTVTLTRTIVSTLVGKYPGGTLLLQGGSCIPTTLVGAAPETGGASSVTCTFTMNGDQTLIIQ